MFNKTVFLVLALSLTMAGCTTMKKITGQTNDTILPGPREDILPPDQQTARDPNVTGGQPVAGNTLQQQPMVQPGMPPQPPVAQNGDLLPGHQGTVVTCDPLVETCPGMQPAPTTKVATKAKTPAAGKVITPAPKDAKAVAGQPAVETVGADPMKPELKPVKKKKKKKLVLKPKDPAAPATDATAPADATTPPVAPDTPPQ
jgi:hypothetical protein